MKPQTAQDCMLLVEIFLFSLRIWVELLSDLITIHTAGSAGTAKKRLPIKSGAFDLGEVN
jgi:hypothetical protein